MFCSYCGKEVDSDSLFCQACGRPIKKDISREQEEPKTNADETTVLWYYLSGNERKGPITEQQITDLVKSGVVDRNTMVWREGFSEWLKTEDTALKYIVQSILPATPMSALSDKWLWALATVPTLAGFILLLFIPSSASFLVTIAQIVLNIVFLSLDTKALRENGYYPETWLYLGILLVPVYLFVRASKTTKNMAPGIVNCILIVLSIFA